jgi:structural maintenance of chromosomes protein 5
MILTGDLPQDQEAETHKSRLENLRQAERDRHRRIESMKDRIARLQKEVDNPPEVGDVEAFKQEVVGEWSEKYSLKLIIIQLAARAISQAITDRQAKLADSQKDVVNLETSHKAIIDDNQRRCASHYSLMGGISRVPRLRQLDDVSHRKLHSLIQWDKDCGDTVTWLRQNRHRFRMEIFEPAMLSITVPNQAFAASIEACFDANSLKVRCC